MRYFLTRQITRAGYFMRSARSLGLLILLFVSLSAHAGDVVAAYAKNKDTVRPVSLVLPGNVSNDEFKKRALAKIKEFQGCLYILCDITAGNTALDNAVDQATGLFVDGAIIEVTWITLAIFVREPTASIMDWSALNKLSVAIMMDVWFMKMKQKKRPRSNW
jgi:hypothetical protein